MSRLERPSVHGPVTDIGNVLGGDIQEQLDKLCDILPDADRADLAVLLSEERGSLEMAIDRYLRRRQGSVVRSLRTQCRAVC